MCFGAEGDTIYVEGSRGCLLTHEEKAFNGPEVVQAGLPRIGSWESLRSHGTPATTVDRC